MSWPRFKQLLRAWLARVFVVAGHPGSRGMGQEAQEVRSIARIPCDCCHVARPSGSRTEAAHGLGGTELEPRMVIFGPDATPLH